MRLTPWLLLAFALLCGCAPGEQVGLIDLPDHLEFRVVEGGPDPAPISVTLSNAGTCPLQAAPSSQTVDLTPWLLVPPLITVPAGGSAQLDVSIQAGALALSPGLYTGTVTIEGICASSGAQAAGTPAEISVNVTVIAAGVAWPISGTVTGLSGTGLELTEGNSAAYTVLDADGPFAFAVADGAPYSVSVTAQPTGPSQICAVSGGSGTVSGGPVSGISVSCLSSCPADALEPNDSLLQPSSLPASPTALEGCPGDPDWFTVIMAPWSALALQVTFSHAEGNLDVVLVDSSTGAPLTSSTSTTDDEALNWTAPTGPTDFGIELSMSGPDTGSLPGSPYSISGTVSCVPDAIEPNDAITTPTSIGSSSTDLTICGDDDWFSISAAPWENVTAVAQFLNAEGDIDLFLFDPLGSPLASSAGMSDVELINYTPTGNGELLRVSMTDAGAVPGNSYVLDINPSCVPDLPEPNEDPSTATPITLPLVSAPYSLCAGDADWFEISLGASETLSVSVNTPQGIAEGDVELQLVDLGGNPLATAATSSPTETLSYTSTGAEIVRLGVLLPSDSGIWAGQGYTLSASAAVACADDGFEPNDDLGAAALITPAYYASLQLCPGSPDFFGVALNTGDFVTVIVSFLVAEGNLDLYVTDPFGTLVGQSTSLTGDFEIVNILVTTTGTYTIDVELTSDSGSSPGVAYDLDVPPGG